MPNIGKRIEPLGRDALTTILALPVDSPIEPVEGQGDLIPNERFILEESGVEFLVESVSSNVSQVQRRVGKSAGGLAAGRRANPFLKAGHCSANPSRQSP